MSDCQDLYTWIDRSDYEWVDDSYFEFGECSSVVVDRLNQLWRDASYVYAATTAGLDIFDIFSTNKVAYIINEGGFTTIWGNDTIIYLGTDYGGIKYLEKVNISGGNLSHCLVDYSYQYNTSSSNIKYLHGCGVILVAVTDIGIDVLNNNSQGFKSTTSGTHFTKCFMTSKNELYYVVQSSEGDGLCKVNTVLCDWDNSDIFYEAGVSFLSTGCGINDIFVTESTSSNRVNNTIFVATDNGAYILDEGTLGFDVYCTKEG